MIDSFDFHNFVNKSIENNLANTSENKLQLFLARTNKLTRGENYFSEEENELFNISNNSILDIYNSAVSLKKEEKTEDDLHKCYFNGKKESNSNKVDYSKKQKIFNINLLNKYDVFDNIENATLSNEKILQKNKVLPTIKRRRENHKNGIFQ